MAELTAARPTEEVIILDNYSSKGLINEIPDITLLEAVSRNDNDLIDCWIKIITKRQESAIEHVHECDESGNSVLHLLVEKNNIQALSDILQIEGLDLNLKNKKDETVVHVACRAGCAEILSLLLGVFEFSLTDEDKEGNPPLHLAVKNQHTEVTKLLLELGRDDINEYCSSESKLTPLHLAVKSRLLDMVRLLVKNGVRVDGIAGLEKMTPLMLAVKEKHVEIVEFLLCEKAAVNIVDAEQRNVFHIASMKGNAGMIQLLVGATTDETLLSSKDKYQCTPLHTAVIHNNMSVVKKFLSLDHEKELKEYEVLILLSAAQGCLEILKELLTLRKGVSINCCDNNGCTPLHFACMNVHLDVVQFLLSQGACSSARTSEEDTPLHLAFQGPLNFASNVPYCISTADEKYQFQNLHKVVALLVKAGAAVTALNKQNRTPMYYAGLNDCSKDSIMILLRNGAQLENFPGKTDLMIELIKTYPDDAVTFLDHCVQPEHHLTTITTTLENVVIEKETGKFCLDVELVNHFFESGEKWLSRKRRSHPLKLLIERKRHALLRHPVITALIRYKWNKYGQVVYLFNLLFYALFLAFLTVFALSVRSPLHPACTVVFDDLDLTVNCTVSSSRRLTILTCSSFTIIFSVFRLLFEFFQYIRLREAYFWDVINWLELILYFSALNFAWVFHSPCFCAQSGQWETGVIAVFLGWILLTVNCDKLAFIGVYITMFITIFKTFLKTILLSVLLIIAFGLSFFMLFGVDTSLSPNPFGSVIRAFIKTMTMSTGEFAYDEIFFQLPDDDLQPIVYPNTSFFLWVIFVILMAVLLTNLLTGLAVGDVKEIQDIAEVKRTQLKIQYLLAIDGFFDLHLENRWHFKESLTVLLHHQSRWQYFLSRISGTAKKVDLAIPASHFMPVYERLKENSSGNTPSEERHDFGKTLVEIKQALATHEKLLAKIVARMESLDTSS